VYVVSSCDDRKKMMFRFGITTRVVADIALFASLVLIIGSSYPFVEMGLETFDTLTMVLVRLVLGGVFLAVWMVLRGTPVPTFNPDLIRLLPLGVLNTLGAFILITWGQQYLPASYAAILVATGPIFAIVGVALFLVDESLTVRRVIGMIIGFAGIVVLFSGGLGDASDAGWLSAVLGVVAIIVSTMLIATVAIVVRRSFSHLEPVQIALPQICAGILMVSILIVVLTPLGIVNPHGSLPGIGVILALLSLGLLNAGVGNLLYYAALSRFGVTGTALVGYIAPVVGVALAIMLLHHRLVWNEVGGMLLVLTSLAVTRVRSIKVLSENA
jgi:drug/metabolite transporter (DMT)-like permease